MNVRAWVEQTPYGVVIKMQDNTDEMLGYTFSLESLSTAKTLEEAFGMLSTFARIAQVQTMNKRQDIREEKAIGELNATTTPPE